MDSTSRTADLRGKKVALLVADGFEQIELTSPQRMLEEAGADTYIVSPCHWRVKGWNHVKWGDKFPVDVHLDDADAGEFDALVLPGGVMNPDKLRRDPRVIDFIRGFFTSGKPVAAICHGPWTLIDAGVAAGRRMTSYASIQTDLINAGAQWVDSEVVVDDGLITSRSPKDLPAFNQEVLREFGSSRRAHHARPPLTSRVHVASSEVPLP